MIPDFANLDQAVVGPDDAVLEIIGIRLSFKATAQSTGGQWALVEYTAPPHFKGPPPHWHKVTTEGFYVVEGQLHLEIGEGEAARVLEAGPGTFALVPPGTVHVWSNPSEALVKYLFIVSPAGLEGYFLELAELVKNAPSWPLPDMTPVMALAAKYDTFAPPVIAGP